MMLVYSAGEPLFVTLRKQ